LHPSGVSPALRTLAKYEAADPFLDRKNRALSPKPFVFRDGKKMLFIHAASALQERL
jgi:hypothetical protein